MFPLHRTQSIYLLKVCLSVGLKYHLHIVSTQWEGARVQKDENGFIWGAMEISIPYVRKTL